MYWHLQRETIVQSKSTIVNENIEHLLISYTILLYMIALKNIIKSNIKYWFLVKFQEKAFTVLGNTTNPEWCN